MNISLIVVTSRINEDFVETEIFQDKLEADKWFSEKRKAVIAADKSKFSERGKDRDKYRSLYTQNGSFVVIEGK